MAYAPFKLRETTETINYQPQKPKIVSLGDDMRTLKFQDTGEIITKDKFTPEMKKVHTDLLLQWGDYQREQASKIETSWLGVAKQQVKGLITGAYKTVKTEITEPTGLFGKETLKEFWNHPLSNYKEGMEELATGAGKKAVKRMLQLGELALRSPDIFLNPEQMQKYGIPTKEELKTAKGKMMEKLQPTGALQQIGYGGYALGEMLLTQKVVGDLILKVASQIPAIKVPLDALSKAVAAKPWTIGYGVAVGKSYLWGRLFGALEDSKNIQEMASNSVRYGNSFAAFQILAYPLAMFFRPVLYKTKEATGIGISKEAQTMLSNPEMDAAKELIYTKGEPVWFKTEDPNILLRVTKDTVHITWRQYAGMSPADAEVLPLFQKQYIETFHYEPSFYDQLKGGISKFLGGKAPAEGVTINMPPTTPPPEEAVISKVTPEIEPKVIETALQKNTSISIPTVYRGEGGESQALRRQMGEEYRIFGEGLYVEVDPVKAQKWGEITEYKTSLKSEDVLKINSQKEYEDLVKKVAKTYPQLTPEEITNKIPEYAKKQGYKAIWGNPKFDEKAGMNIIDELAISKPKTAPTPTIEISPIPEQVLGGRITPAKILAPDIISHTISDLSRMAEIAKLSALSTKIKNIEIPAQIKNVAELEKIITNALTPVEKEQAKTFLATRFGQLKAYEKNPKEYPGMFVTPTVEQIKAEVPTETRVPEVTKPTVTPKAVEITPKEVKITSAEEKAGREIYQKEFERIQTTYEDKLMADIKTLGGLKTDPTLKEEMSDLPINIMRKDGVTPDEMLDMLDARGYDLKSVSDMFDSIRAISSMPTRFKPAESVLEQKLTTIKAIRTKMPKIKEVTTAQLERLERNLLKEATVGKNIPPKQVIAKVTGLRPPPEEKIATATQLLKVKLKGEAKGARVGISYYRREQRFLEALEKEIKRSIAVPKGRERSRISFIRKLAEFPQTVINEVKRDIGLEGSIRNANLEQLLDVTQELKKRYQFKLERGYKPSAETIMKLRLKSVKEEPMAIPETEYAKNRQIIKTAEPTMKEKLVRTIDQTKKMAETILTPISTRLYNIDPSLKYALRKLEFDTFHNSQRDFRQVRPYLQSLKKLDKNDFVDLDLALKNGDVNKISAINKKYGIEKEYKAVTDILDDLYKRANEVGFDIGYQKDYFPRRIKDVKGFLEYFEKKEWWSAIDEAIKRKEMDLGRYLTSDEKAYLINNMIRGYRGGQVTLSKTGAMKSRMIDYVSPELNKFYEDSISSISKYVGQINSAIEARNFFGKHRVGEGKEEQFNNIEDSIGAYVTDLLAKDKITPDQEFELRNILNARFNPRGTHGIVGLYKNLSYIDVMGSPYNAITQSGEIVYSIYRNGIISALKESGKSIVGVSKVKMQDIGIDQIAEEFRKEGLGGRMVNFVFKVTGLNKIDRTFKESLVNGSIQRFQKLAKNPTPRFMQQMKEIFGKEMDSVMTDLKKGVISENVKYLAFNELLDFQPLALSEMPEQYIKGGNGRIFYMLKTFTLKQLDTFRTETFHRMGIGNPGDFVSGLKNLIWFSVLIMLCNAGADEIKDLMIGRKTSLKDKTIEQLLTLMGLSRYNLTRIQTEGLGSALLEQLIPPTKSLDSIWKDLTNIQKNWGDSIEINKLRTIESIPFIGKLYYWWFGKGVETREKYYKEQEIPAPPKPQAPPKPPKPPKPSKPKSSIENLLVNIFKKELA
jgi:hypothetical protein